MTAAPCGTTRGCKTCKLISPHYLHFETIAIRTQTEHTQHREHSTPIFPTSSFVFNDAEQMRAMFADEVEGNIYSRFTNPGVLEFEEKMAALEGVEDAFALVIFLDFCF